jgi:hypothetical protein
MTPNQNRFQPSSLFIADRQLAVTVVPGVSANDARFNKQEFVGAACDAEPPAPPSNWLRIFPGL